MNCPHCHKYLPTDLTATGCPFCGSVLQPPVIPGGAAVATLATPNRAACWIIFLLASLGGGASAYWSLVAQADSTFFPSLLAGAICSGFALARSFSKTIRGLIVTGILLSVAVAVVYAAILFAGCAIALQDWAT